jgi:hypothetical protein
MTAAAPGPHGIPAFVVAGLANFAPDGQVTYRSEADLRDTLAMHWWLAGAPSVQTEVKVPDCGRIDVLVDLDCYRLLYEVKRQIATPTQARQAFQQAHAYDAYLSAGGGSPIHAHVIAADYSYLAAEAAELAYPYIAGSFYLTALNEIPQRATDRRMPHAESRSVMLSRLADMARGYYLDAARGVESVGLDALAEESA